MTTSIQQLKAENQLGPEPLSTAASSGNTLTAASTDHDERRILDAAIAILAQGELLLNSLEQDKYCRKVAEAFNASIGGHYRHCLDHFLSFERGLGGLQVDYDDRDRDARIETDRAFALSQTQRLREVLQNLSPSLLRNPVKAGCEVSYAVGSCPVTDSSFGRELVYCIAHAIHHYALIAVMARLMDAKLPQHFGVAPSTVAHLASNSGR